jgi:cysteine desulfurase/selenocysteine lyase
MTAEGSGFDPYLVREDFPIFQQSVKGKPLSYLDSAASAQKPRQLLDTMRLFYETSYSNVHRGVYELSERATEAFEAARRKVAAFVNAGSWREIIFTRNTTESLNLVAYAWALNNLAPGDIVLATELEHHSNFVPWQYVAKRTGATFRVIPIDDSGRLDLGNLEGLARGGVVKLVACTLVSNTLGTICPVEQVAAWAHERGALMVCDVAQAAPHRAVDVRALGCDFAAFSGHKVCGPSGVGILWARLDVLEQMAPFNVGSHMISRVQLDETTWAGVPERFEAGTSPIAEAVGLGAAIDYLASVGMKQIEEHERRMLTYALERLDGVSGLTLYGPEADARTGILSFNVHDVHPHDVAQVLDTEGVAIRAGHHCCQPLMSRLGVVATNRASFYLYTIPEEIDRLVSALERTRKLFA